MSKGTLGQVVKRAISDAAFRRQLQSDPEGALKGFDLTSDERAALRSGDAAKLSGFGVDQRMSKAFALGEGASGVTVGANSSELSDSGGARAAFIDQGTSDGSGAQSALIDQQSVDGSGTLSSLIDQGSGGGRAALDSSGNVGREGTAYITADEAGRDASPAAAAASDSSATTAFMTSDEMGNDVSAYADNTVAGDDALQGDTTTNTWAGENAEPQA